MPIPGRLSLFGFIVSAALLSGCPNSAGITCPPGLNACNGKCISVGGDSANCGACGKVCPGALACINGSCGCPGGLTNCADVCVDQNVDGNNCGGCGTACVAGMVCSAASCQLTCGANLQQCGASCIDTQNDPLNCGMCQHPCGTFESCCAGSCVTAGTDAHCGSCAPCPSGYLCFDAGGDMGLMCSAG